MWELLKEITFWHVIEGDEKKLDTFLLNLVSDSLAGLLRFRKE